MFKADVRTNLLIGIEHAAMTSNTAAQANLWEALQSWDEGDLVATGQWLIAAFQFTAGDVLLRRLIVAAKRDVYYRHRLTEVR